MLMITLIACAPADYSSGAGEPIIVRDGTFQVGEMPSGAAEGAPEIRYVASVGYVITQGTGNVGYSGLASKDAWSVALSFPGIGSGYWIVPVDGPDVTQDGDLLFDMSVDFRREVPYGLQSVEFSAVGADGEAGPIYSSTICVLPDHADNNLAACDSETLPQNAVLSLSWDRDADLDLVVITPEGKEVSWKAPSTLMSEDITSTDLADPTVGQLTRDSNGNCRIDSIRLESLVFPGEPPAGDYQVYLRQPSSCGQPAVNWSLSLFRRIEVDGAFPVERTELAQGQLLGTQVDAEGALGSYVTTLTLP